MAVFSNIFDAIKQAIVLGERVERLSEDVSKLADRYVEETRARDAEIRELDRRLQKIENMIEFAEIVSSKRLPSKDES